MSTRKPCGTSVVLLVAALAAGAQANVDDLPPDAPYFKPTYPPGYRVPAFEECGGRGKDELKCEKGCWCAQKDDNSYHKECTPPKGYSTCSAKRARQFLKIAQEKFDEWDSKAEETKKTEEEADQAAKEWLQKAVEAKKASKEANETYDKIKFESAHSEVIRVNTATQEAKAAIAEIQNITRDSYVKYAGIYKDAEAKLGAAQSAFDEAQKAFEKAKADAAAARGKVESDMDAKVKAAEDKLAQAKDDAPKKVDEATAEEQKANDKAASDFDRAHRSAKTKQREFNEANKAAVKAADEAAAVHAKIKVWADTLK